MYDDDLTDFETGLRQLKVEYDIFFNGCRPRPPEDLRFRVERIVKRLAEAGSMTYSQRFRYNTLVARYYAFRDLWRRSIAAREAGEASERRSAASEDKPKAESLDIAIGDPREETHKVRELYEALRSVYASGGRQDAMLPYEEFQRYIARKTEGIRGKHGCEKVLFTIANDEDSVKFTARAEK